MYRIGIKFDDSIPLDAYNAFDWYYMQDSLIPSPFTIVDNSMNLDEDEFHVLYWVEQ